MSVRKGEWSRTYSGRVFWPLDPRPEDVAIEDIAHHLALINRFNGALVGPYSVGQHSLGVAWHVDDVVGLNDPARGRMLLTALLHDASEAYCGDMIAPIKRQMPSFREVDDAIALAVGERFGLGRDLVELPSVVKVADRRMLATEKRDLRVSGIESDSARQSKDPADPPYGDRLVIMDWRRVESLFLEAFRAYAALVGT